MAQGTLLKSCYLGVNKRSELGFRIGTEVGFYKGTDAVTVVQTRNFSVRLMPYLLLLKDIFICISLAATLHIKPCQNANL